MGKQDKTHGSSVLKSTLAALVGMVSMAAGLLMFGAAHASAAGETCSVRVSGDDAVISFVADQADLPEFVNVRRQGRYYASYETGAGREIRVPFISGTTTHYSLAILGGTNLGAYTYCGSVQGTINDVPVVQSCRIQLTDSTSASLRVNFDKAIRGITVRRNGAVIRQQRTGAFPASITVPVVPGVNHFSVNAWNEAGTSSFRYCGSERISAGSQPALVSGCNYFAAGGGEAYIDLSLPAPGANAPQTLAVHVWRNGVVVDTVLLPSRIGATELSGYPAVAGSHVSVSTGRVGDAPDPSRRTYCGQI